MKVLVLGAAGFLGSNLVRALLAQGDRVRGLIRPSNPAPTLRDLDIERITGDLNIVESLRRACERCADRLSPLCRLLPSPYGFQ